MDFELSADQELLRESLRRFLSERAPITPYVRDRLSSAVHVGAVLDDPVWLGLAEMGLLGLLVGEEHGGAGMGMVDAAVVLEELGRAVCPAPFVASAIGAISAVCGAGGASDQASLLPGLAAGTSVGAVALFEAGRRWSWDTPDTNASVADGKWTVSGEKVHVADGAAASLFVVSARVAGGLALFTVDRDAAGVDVATTPSVDGTRGDATVRFTDAPARPLNTDDAVARSTIATVLDRMGVADVVDGVGAAARALELAVDYAKERVQFDRPIGSFQAVQHLCADMLRTVELGRAAAYYACWASGAADATEAHRAATLACAFAADAFPQLGGTAIQIFGGIGFTWEHDIHLYFKRLLSQSIRFGTADTHLAALASQILTP